MTDKIIHQAKRPSKEYTSEARQSQRRVDPQGNLGSLRSEAPIKRSALQSSKKGNLSLIGLGLNENSLTTEALDAIKQSDKLYLENYTINFPYKIKDLNLNITKLNREQVENESILKEAKSKKISLLIYGDPLSATTHLQLILEAKKQNIPTKIFHNASILTAVAETGLSLYKFGKTTSMPNWKEHTNKPKSFADVIKQNQSIQAHTLILTDINLTPKDAIDQLNQSIKLNQKIIVLSNAGTKNQKIHILPSALCRLPSISMPFCLIIPSKLHFIEEEYLIKSS